MKIRRVSLLSSEIALLIYVFLIPIEDFFLQDLIGSSSRLAGGVMILLYIFTRPSLIWSYGPNLFYLYFLWAGISILFWANNPDYYSVFRLFMWMLTTLVTTNIISRNISLLPLVFKTYIISSLYLVIMAVKNFTIKSVNELERVDVEGMNQNLLASQFLICIVYLLFRYFKSDGTFKSKVFLIGLIFLFLLGIIASGSRSALLSVVVSFLLLSPKNYFRFSNISQVFIIIFIFFLFLKSDNSFTQLLNDRLALVATDNGASRLIIWKVAVSIILDNPILGVGYRNFPTEFANYIGITSLDSEEWLRLGERTLAGTHNAMLETISELGLIGFFFFYGFQYRLLKGLKRNNWNYGFMFFVMIITINVNALFGDLANLKYFWLVIGIGFGFQSAFYNSISSSNRA
jgi:O-antigen ligase